MNDPNFTATPGLGLTAVTGAPQATIDPRLQQVKQTTWIEVVPQPNGVERSLDSVGKFVTTSAHATAIIITSVGALTIGVVTTVLSTKGGQEVITRFLPYLFKAGERDRRKEVPRVLPKDRWALFPKRRLSPPPPPPQLTDVTSPPDMPETSSPSPSRLQEGDGAPAVEVKSEPIPEPIIPRQASPENEAAPEPEKSPEDSEEEDTAPTSMGDLVARR